MCHQETIWEYQVGTRNSIRSNPRREHGVKLPMAGTFVCHHKQLLSQLCQREASAMQYMQMNPLVIAIDAYMSEQVNG